MANGGYQGACSTAIGPTGDHACADRQRATVRERHNTTNRRFKYIGNYKKHSMIATFIVTMTQLMIVNGEHLFEAGAIRNLFLKINSSLRLQILIF